MRFSRTQLESGEIFFFENLFNYSLKIFSYSRVPQSELVSPSPFKRGIVGEDMVMKSITYWVIDERKKCNLVFSSLISVTFYWMTFDGLQRINMNVYVQHSCASNV